MCLLAVLFRAIDDCPVLVAASREEFYDRQGTAPEIWGSEPVLVAGRDPRAGGTWLGVNRSGVLVAIANRPKGSLPTPLRSRGLLCRDLLACLSAREAHQRALGQLEQGPYAGCNVLAVDASGAYVIHSGDLIRSQLLPPGIHALSASDLNDSFDRRIARALEWLRNSEEQTVSGWVSQLQRLCAAHGEPGQAEICLHGDGRGTVSASIVVLPEPLDQARWIHAQGPPCRTPFVDCSDLLRELFSGRGEVAES